MQDSNILQRWVKQAAMKGVSYDEFCAQNRDAYEQHEEYEHSPELIAFILENVSEPDEGATLGTVGDVVARYRSHRDVHLEGAKMVQGKEENERREPSTIIGTRAFLGFVVQFR